MSFLLSWSLPLALTPHMGGLHLLLLRTNTIDKLGFPFLLDLDLIIGVPLSMLPSLILFHEFRLSVKGRVHIQGLYLLQVGLDLEFCCHKRHPLGHKLVLQGFIPPF